MVAAVAAVAAAEARFGFPDYPAATSLPHWLAYSPALRGKQIYIFILINFLYFFEGGVVLVGWKQAKGTVCEQPLINCVSSLPLLNC